MATFEPSNNSNGVRVNSIDFGLNLVASPEMPSKRAQNLLRSCRRPVVSSSTVSCAAVERHDGRTPDSHEMAELPSPPNRSRRIRWPSVAFLSSLAVLRRGSSSHAPHSLKRVVYKYRFSCFNTELIQQQQQQQQQHQQPWVKKSISLSSCAVTSMPVSSLDGRGDSGGRRNRFFCTKARRRVIAAC